jgi:hypothetical protein
VILIAMLGLIASPGAAETFYNRIQPSTTNNDDSCDITVAPAATLLLPFFDVDLSKPDGAGDTTLFTVTNVTSAPQIAHVTIWSDWAFPVLTFNLVLTGYDVQSVNLYDVIARGVIAPGGQPDISPRLIAGPGSQPGFNGGNPNHFDEPCAGTTLKPELVAAIQSALITGLYNIGSTRVCGTQRIGGTHTNARGYVTIDVVASCSSALPSNPAYYTTQILFDNALIGDYQQVNGGPLVGTFSNAAPMVHIRAIPEGGPAGYDAPTSLPYTFYDGYTPAANRKIDRRVPLPSTLAVRWVEAGNAIQTLYKIWREGPVRGVDAATCSKANGNFGIYIGEEIRFDESENSFAVKGALFCGAVCHLEFPSTPATLIVNSSNTVFFPAHAASPDVAGWLYLNLNDPTPGLRSRPSQNWVTAVMFAQGRYAVEFDAAQLGNGCTPTAVVPSPQIGPAR